ncbi:MAG: extracellular solute-binding protein [Clostridiales bacterium]|nr:extracellular solute-binding protein [Clostridiales bacterium]
MKKKTISKILSVVLAMSMVVPMAACGTKTGDAPANNTSSEKVAEGTEAPAESTATPTSITLWTYPIGSWGDSATVDGLIASFNEVHPEITVTVEYLDYTNGDDQINTAIEGGEAPDMVMEGPERLVANWGAKGLMVDLSDLWTAEAKSDIYESVEAACKGADGVYYEYPLCMTAHTMAVNRDLFEAADALQYLDEETHTWTTENFVKACEALVAYGQKNAGAVFCAGQGGDQGTRALVNNLYGGTFTNAEHTEYTVNSQENIKALELLASTPGINFDSSIVGGDEITLFCNETLGMAFCWNVAQERTHKITTPDTNFEILPMAFPSDDGEAELCGGIWGFGIFDNGDEAKIAASKTFIDFICNDANQVEDSVKASTYWSVRKSLADMYADDELMSKYSVFVPMMGDYYQVVGGWAEARTAWWNMLQQIGSGTDVTTAVETFSETANAAAAAAQ